MAAKLNCWLVAMWFWIGSFGHQYAWIRRSHSFRQLIPHFGYTEQTGFRSFRSIEYSPPKGKLWTREDFGICFEGEYIVTYFKLVTVKRFKTKEQAIAARKV